MISKAMSFETPAIIRLTMDTKMFYDLEIGYLRDLIVAWHDDPGDARFFTFKEPETAGYIYYAPQYQDRVWWIWWIAVDPKHQKLGIGKQLIEFAEKDVREHNGRLLLLETSSAPWYEGTREFYKKVGYEVLHDIPDYYKDGDGQTLFGKRLQPEAEPDAA